MGALRPVHQPEPKRMVAVLGKHARTRPELLRLLEESKAQVAAMSDAEREAMLAKQRESFVRGEMSWPKPKFKWVNGVKVYDSYEDYCND